MEQIIYTILLNYLNLSKRLRFKFWNWYLNKTLGSFNRIKTKVFFRGKSIVSIDRLSCIEIGHDVVINSGPEICVNSSEISKIYVNKGGKLIIGCNSGISATTIHVRRFIKIGNNVNIGSGSIIIDSDFHSLNPAIRIDRSIDHTDIKSREIEIGDNVFIGARSIILKGTTIGNNTIIAAGSVVPGVKIPDNEIWGGNPVKFIKKI